MVLLGKESYQCLRICRYSLVSDHVCEIVDSVKLFRCLVQTLCHEVFQLLGHPYDTLDSALCLHELLGRDEVLAVSHEARCLHAAACHGRHLREGHSKRRHARVLTVGDDNAVGERLDTADTLEASAGGHGILHDGIQGYMLQGALGKVSSLPRLHPHKNQGSRRWDAL